jgi:hypothetical protein
LFLKAVVFLVVIEFIFHQHPGPFLLISDHFNNNCGLISRFPSVRSITLLEKGIPGLTDYRLRKSASRVPTTGTMVILPGNLTPRLFRLKRRVYYVRGFRIGLLGTHNIFLGSAEPLRLRICCASAQGKNVISRKQKFL